MDPATPLLSDYAGLPGTWDELFTSTGAPRPAFRRAIDALDAHSRAGFAVCDVLSGATAAFGVSSALFQRTHTGRGQLIDVSMLEATLAFLSGQVADYSVAGHCQHLSGNQAVSRRPTANLFKAGEGYLLLAVNSEKQYQALMC